MSRRVPARSAGPYLLAARSGARYPLDFAGGQVSLAEAST